MKPMHKDWRKHQQDAGELSVMLAVPWVRLTQAKMAKERPLRLKGASEALKYINNIKVIIITWLCFFFLFVFA